MWKKAFLIMSVTLFVSGCRSDEELSEAENGDNVQQKPNEEQLPLEEEIVEEFVFPLTGEVTGEQTNQRSVAVMINNHPKARPQSGLHEADIVYEILAEGDITRLLAIYQSSLPDVVGPIRSARDYFIDIAKGYNSMYIAHGYSPEAKSMLEDGVIDHINGIQYDGTLFHREDFRVAPHNSYITKNNLLKGADQLGYNMEGSPASLMFRTDEKELIEGNVSTFAVSYYENPSFTSKYQYVAGNYERWVNGEQTLDLETESPVHLKNVLIVEVPHATIDSAGRRELSLTSGGNGLLFQNGEMKEITWKNEKGLIVPYNGDEQAKLVPGKTWVHVIPTNPGISQMVSY
ncbi:DUF3048 domain-containing protein [Bacillus spongiae]|uniref:DUF3048 domain-containing protein n=1 Tax=Bacillus spongiae TaxID=2683610 RepID=A0ABU8HDD5_9BACI